MTSRLMIPLEVRPAIGLCLADESGKVTQLIALTPSAGPWRKKLADAAVKWSSAGGCPTGDPSLHHYLGELYHKGWSSDYVLPGLCSPRKEVLDRHF